MSRFDDRARLLVCIICQRPEDGPARMDAPRTGSRLLAELKAQAAGDPRFAGLSIEPAPCLYNCQRDCSVQVRTRGKSGYILEWLAPDAGVARAVLDVAAAHMASPDGTVTEAQALLGGRGKVSGSASSR